MTDNNHLNIETTPTAKRNRARLNAIVAEVQTLVNEHTKALTAAAQMARLERQEATTLKTMEARAIVASLTDKIFTDVKTGELRIAANAEERAAALQLRLTADQRYADSQYRMAEYRQSREEAEAEASGAAAMIAINREALKHESALMIYNAAITSGNN
jgi:hypothetical protein